MFKSAVITLCLISISAFGAKLTNPKCTELDAISSQRTPQYLAVVDGYRTANQKDAQVDMASIVRESDEVKTQCGKNKDAPLAEVRKNIAAVTPQGLPHETTNGAIDPTKANCINFLALDERYQPLAAYWVAGRVHDGEVKTGQVDEVYLSYPVGRLVEQCKATPMTSFYETTKAWLKGNH